MSYSKVDWNSVKPARWLPMGDGLVMVGWRVIGVIGELQYVPWVQHTCGAWFPLGRDRCLYCQEPVRTVMPL